jgi:hypothetical protein
MAYNMEVPVATLLRGIAVPEVAYLIASFVPTGFVVDLLAPRLEPEAMDIAQAGLAVECYYSLGAPPMLSVDPRLWELFADVIKRIGWSTPDAQLQLQRFFLPMPMSRPMTTVMTEGLLVHDRLAQIFAEALHHLRCLYEDLVNDPAEGMSPSWISACDEDLCRLARTMWNILGVARGMVDVR